MRWLRIFRRKPVRRHLIQRYGIWVSPDAFKLGEAVYDDLTDRWMPVQFSGFRLWERVR